MSAWGCNSKPRAPIVEEQRSGNRIGDRAPTFTLPARDGSTFSLDSARGKVVFLNFWATWCGPCRIEMPSIEKLQRQMAGKDFLILAVSVDDAGWSVVDEFIQSNNLTFKVLLDQNQKAAKSFSSYRFPETYIIDKKGIIVDKRVGAADWSHPKAVEYFTTLAAESAAMSTPSSQ